MSHEDHILKSILRELRMIRRELTPRRITAAIAVKFTGAKMENVLNIKVGQTSTATLLELTSDGVTASGGVPSSVVFTFNDPSATVVLDPDGVSALITGVAVSNGPIAGTVTATITDTDGAVSQFADSFTIEVDADVTAPVPLTKSIAVNFSTPA